jgi:FGGY-family pentulose kinase
MVGRAARSVSPWQPESGLVEQSSEAIWQLCGECVRSALADAAVSPEAVASIGFEAVGSLVALDRSGDPCSVSPSAVAARNVILELDQRATREAEAVNATDHEALRYAGGAVTPEHALPRLRWLKTNLPRQYAATRIFLDLSEFLVYRASGELVRSQGAVSCQWLYQANADAWPMALLEHLGLAELATTDAFRAPVKPPGAPAGTLTPEAARSLGLAADTVVATGLVDAAAGGIGLLGAEPEGRMAIVTGASACHLAVSQDPVYAPGIGGPAKGAMDGQHWISHAGQSAFGVLLDYVISDSAGYPELLRGSRESGRPLHELLAERVHDLEQREENPTRTLHVLDYHYGNRAPRSDPAVRGMVSGLTLDQDVDALARRYLATMQALCYGTRHIVEVMSRNGHNLESLRVCGQLAENPLWCRELADATGLPLEVPRCPDPLLRGSAMAAATAAGHFSTIRDAMAANDDAVDVVEPRLARAHFHEAKYQVYCRLYDDQMAYRELMGRV